MIEENTSSDQPLQQARNKPDEKFLFVEELLYNLQKFGVASSRMMIDLVGMVKELGIHGQFLVTPDSSQSVLWGENKEQDRIHLTIQTSGNYDLNKLNMIYDMMKQVKQKEISIGDARIQLKSISEGPPLYSKNIYALAFFLCGIGFSAIVGATWQSVVVAGLCSLITFLLILLSNKFTGILPLLEFIVALIVTILANIISVKIPEVNFAAVIAGAVVWFIPGFSLTMAANESIYGYTLSGQIWLHKSIITAFKLIGGFTIGMVLASRWHFKAPTVSPGHDLGSFWLWIAVAVLVIGLAINMNVQIKQLGYILIGGLLVWAALQLGNLIGFWQGTFLGAIVMMISSNFFSTRKKLPPSIMLLTNVMILVPGLAALDAIYVIGTTSLQDGIKALMSVLVLIMAIIGGVMVGEIISLNTFQLLKNELKTIIKRKF